MGALDRVFRSRRPSQERPAAAIVAGLWRNGEQGVWYDPSDLSTMFQDASGTTPVYMPGQGQPDCWIGLQLDKRRGLTRGPEMLSNGDFSGGAAGWGVAGADATHVVDFTGGACRYKSDTTSPVLTVSQGSLSIVAGRWYELTIVVSSWVSGGIKTDLFSGAAAGGLALASSAGTFRAIGLATSTTSVFSFLRNAANTDLTIDSISVRELPGNHRWQGTATSRPVLSARYNLLTSSEAFSNSAWAKSATASITPSAGAFIFRCGSTGSSQIYNAAAISGSIASYTVRIRAKAEFSGFLVVALVDLIGGGYSRVWYDLSSGVARTNRSGAGGTFVSKSIKPVSDGSFICELTGAFSSATNIRVALNLSEVDDGFNGSASSGVYLYSADARVANDGVGLPEYQRVLDASNYDTVGFPLYRKTDGVDDWMQTASVDFSAASVLLIAFACRKLSDAAAAVMLESSSVYASSFGTFLVSAPHQSGQSQYGVGYNNGTTYTQVFSGFTSPVSSVLVATLNLAATPALTSIALRANGTTVSPATVSGAVSTGQFFGNYPLYFDRRGGTSLPFSGRDYGTIIVGRLLTAPETAAVEKLLRSKSRAY